jgi:hypothetical protein
VTHVRPTNPFFTVGGTLPLDAVYVVRPVDEQLFRVALAGEYCNVLTPRQMGKSSLMVCTVERLAQEGVYTAALDLTDIGTELGADEWYLLPTTFSPPSAPPTTPAPATRPTSA